MLSPAPSSPSPLPCVGSLALFFTRRELARFVVVGLFPLMGLAETPLTIARPNRSDPIDFRREILPVLQANCLPCHNKTTTKADLLLETPAEMLKGGETGPAIVAGNAAASLLLRLSSHAEKPRMPPRDNKVNAVDLTPEQLGLLARWIDEGAHEGERRTETVRWLDSAPPLRAIYSVAWSPDGEFVACGRGQRVFIYHRPTAQLVTELTQSGTESSNRPAHRDLVGALAFRPDGQQLASGGFREVKLWRRLETAFQRLRDPVGSMGATNSVRCADGTRLVRPGTNGIVELVDADEKRIAELHLDARAVEDLKVARLSLTAGKSEAAVIQKRLEATEKEDQQQTERLGKAREARVKADDLVEEKRRARDKAAGELELAEAALAALKSEATADEKKPLEQRVESAKKPVDDARRAFDEAARKQAVSEEEFRLAELAIQRSHAQVRRWKDAQAGVTQRVSEAEARVKEREKAAELPPAALAAISADAKWIATAQGERISVWSGLSGEPVETWDTPGPVQALGFGLGPTLQLRTDTGDYIRDLLPRWELQQIIGGEESPGPFVDRVGALAYSPNGRWLASGSGEPSRSGDVQWWDPPTGALVGALTNLHSDTVASLAFSPDSTVLSSGGADRMARLVDVVRGQPTRVLEGHTGHVLATAWKDDDTTLATAGADLVVKFWDSVTGEKRKQGTGFEREVTGLAFLSGDQWIACGSPRELRIINENGDRVRGLMGLTDSMHALAVTADGHWIAAGGEDGVLRIWDREIEAPKLVFETKLPELSTAVR